MPNLTIRHKAVEECLVWAERQGYVFGRKAAITYALDKGLGIGTYDLGSYGEEIEFFDTPTAATKAQEQVPGKFNPHKALA